MTRQAGMGMPIAARSSIADVLRRPPVDPLEARILLSHCLGLSRVQLVTQSDRLLTESEACGLTALFERRLAGEPIAYLVGEREFHNLAFFVTPAVLIPRPETELLVELACQRLPRQGRILDLGTGSGAIAVSIAHIRPDATVVALDNSAAALDVARRNAIRHAAVVQFIQSDWYAALEKGQRFDMIVSNPPYIADRDPHLERGDLRFEPAGALTDFADGLSALRAIAADASRHLVTDGWLLMEHGYDQAEPVSRILRASGFENVQNWQDLAAIDRVTGGQLAERVAQTPTHPGCQ